MEWNVFPNYKVPVDFIWYDEAGEKHVEHIGWISTPDMAILKKDNEMHKNLIKP